MGNKASLYYSIFKISHPWLKLFFYNACPCYLKSRRDLLYHRWFWSLKMQALTGFVENSQSIIRVLYSKCCRMAASAPHVMRNQKFTNVRKTTTLIRSNTVNIINPNHHLILLSWTIVSLGDEQSERACEWHKWAVWVSKQIEWLRRKTNPVADG